LSPAIPVSTIYGAGTDTWNASAYAALSMAWRVSASLKNQNAIFTLTISAWKMDSALRHFLVQIYKAAENPQSVTSGPITEQQILEAAKTCRQIHSTIEQIYIRAKGAGLTNRRFIGAAINSIKVRAEDILEIGEALEMSINKDVDQFLDRSVEDLRNGSVYHLPAFK
jgi:hypothetical protein